MENELSPFKGEPKRVQWQVADTIDYALLKENAKANRGNMTEAESVFWKIAKGSGLGQKCRRQYIIGQYIVDFFFRKSMLIVEIDGGYHRPDPQDPLKGDEADNTIHQLTGDLLKDFARPLRESWRGSEQIEYDRIRQDWLEHMGYKMIRFTNEQILFDTDNSINAIKKHLSI